MPRSKSQADLYSRNRADMTERLDHLFERGVWRYRHVMGPPFIAVLLTGAALIVWACGWAMVASLVVVFLMCLVGLPQAHEEKPGRERAYAYACWVAAAGWFETVSWFGAPKALDVAASAVLIVLWVPWYVHRRVRRGMAVDKNIPAWGDGSKVGLPGVKFVPGKAGADWWSARLEGKVKGTVTRDQIRGAKARIAALYDVSTSEVELEDRPSEGEATLIVRKANPDKTPEPFPLPTKRTSIEGPKEVGRYPDGKPSYIVLYADGIGSSDGAALGVKGSGKSSLGELVAEHSIASTNALTWVVDLKPGAQHWKGWESALDWLIDTPEKLDVMYQVILALTQYRGKTGTSPIHVPIPTSPAVTNLLDESALAFSAKYAKVGDFEAAMTASQVVGQRVVLMENNIRVLRSFAVSNWFFTQYGIVDAFGSGTILAELTAGNLAVFRTAKYQDASLVAPSLPVDPSKFSKGEPGTTYLNSPASEREMTSRMHFRTLAEKAELIRRFPADAPDAPRFNEGELAAIRAAVGDAYDRRKERTLSRPSPAGVPAPVSPGLDFAAANATPAVSPVAARLTPAESRQLIWDTLAAFPDGAGPTKVAEVAEKSATLVAARLRELVELGWAKKVGWGGYVTVRGPGGSSYDAHQ